MMYKILLFLSFMVLVSCQNSSSTQNEETTTKEATPTPEAVAPTINSFDTLRFFHKKKRRYYLKNVIMSV